MADPRRMATTVLPIRSYLDGEVTLKLPTPNLRIPVSDQPRPRTTPLHLIACSRCLRVLRDDHWVRAETVIRDLRTFEQDVPRFEPVLCPLCTFSIRLRRAEAPVTAPRPDALQGPARPLRGNRRLAARMATAS